MKFTYDKIKKVLENVISITELIFMFETVSQPQPYLMFIFIYLFVKLNIVPTDIIGVFEKDWRSLPIGSQMIPDDIIFYKSVMSKDIYHRLKSDLKTCYGLAKNLIRYFDYQNEWCKT